MQIFLMRAAKSAASAAALAVALVSPALVSSSFAQAPAGAQQRLPPRAVNSRRRARTGRIAPNTIFTIPWRTNKTSKSASICWISGRKNIRRRILKDLRVQAYLGTLGPLSQQDPSVRPKAIEYCKKVLSTDSKNFTALYWLAINAPMAGGGSPTPEQISRCRDRGQRAAAGAEAGHHVRGRLG